MKPTLRLSFAVFVFVLAFAASVFFGAGAVPAAAQQSDAPKAAPAKKPAAAAEKPAETKPEANPSRRRTSRHTRAWGTRIKTKKSTTT